MPVSNIYEYKYDGGSCRNDNDNDNHGDSDSDSNSDSDSDNTSDSDSDYYEGKALRGAAAAKDKRNSNSNSNSNNNSNGNGNGNGNRRWLMRVDENFLSELEEETSEKLNHIQESLSSASTKKDPAYPTTNTNTNTNANANANTKKSKSKSSHNSNSSRTKSPKSSPKYDKNKNDDPTIAPTVVFDSDEYYEDEDGNLIIMGSEAPIYTRAPYEEVSIAEEVLKNFDPVTDTTPNDDNNNNNNNNNKNRIRRNKKNKQQQDPIELFLPQEENPQQQQQQQQQQQVGCPGDLKLVRQKGSLTVASDDPVLDAVTIVHQSTTTVTVALNQVWGDVVGSFYYQFFEPGKNFWGSARCYQQDEVSRSASASASASDPAPAPVDTVELACSVLSPYAQLQLCLVDDISRKTLLPPYYLATEEDPPLSVVPKCCYPESTIPFQQQAAVCYMLQVKCSPPGVGDEPCAQA
eukprot:jgi/Psemu1/18822/gm1.18822_g